MEPFDVAIVGAGASGVLAAVHLHRISRAASVAVVDAGARAARGLAYGTPYGAHLLNVAAARMSAFADDADHFARWWKAREAAASAKAFAPRRLYGAYLAEVLAESGAPPSRLVRISGTAVGLTRPADGGPWTLHLHDGRGIGARSVVLALGNLAPADPLRLGEAAPRNYLRDPWAPGAAQGLPADAPIALIGTGLTMIDLVLALRAEGHRGVVHAISRRGLLPHAHAAHAPRPIGPPNGQRSPRALLRWIRKEVAHAADWRTVIDALRPHTRMFWQSWSLGERASFLRHARVFWDVHRHRAAPEVASEVEALIAHGALRIHAARVVAMREVDDDLEVQSIRRRDGATQVLRVARVINCTGPASDYATLDLPLVAQLRRSGWLVPDALRLGVETDDDGRLVGADGRAVAGLFTIGPLRRAALWESTAIPEIREQAAALARLVQEERA